MLAVQCFQLLVPVTTQAPILVRTYLVGLMTTQEDCMHNHEWAPRFLIFH